MMMKENKWFHGTAVVVLTALLCNALWGSAFSCIKLGYEWLGIGKTGDKLLFAGLRFMLAGVLVILYGSFTKKKIVFPATGTEWRRVLHLCLYQTVLQYLLFYIGLSNTSGVKASIVEGSNVFVAILIACVIPTRVRDASHMTKTAFDMSDGEAKAERRTKYVWQEKMTGGVLIGCLLGFAGVVLVNLTSDGIEAEVRLNGEGFVFLSTFAYGISTVLIKRYSAESDTVMLSGWQFLCGGAILAVIGVSDGGGIALVTVRGVLMLLYLALVSAVAYTLWGILLKYNLVSKIAVFGFSNPVFGVMLSALLLGEGSVLSIRCLIALALVCVGIYIVNRR